MNNKLVNKTALVTGASRGVGRGIAIGLGEYGATVYITGRNEKSLKQTALLVEKAGGECIPVKCNHSIDSDTIKVFDQIRMNRDSLSILVNCAWGGYETMAENGIFTWNNKFWNQPVWRWDNCFDVGVRSIFSNSKFAMELMKRDKTGLVANISYWAAQKYIANIIYGAAKAATDKLTSDMAFELMDSKISVVSLYPGLVRTEEVMKNSNYFDLSNSESPQFIGRVISELFLDPHLKQLSGSVVVAAALAKKYGIKDTDGKEPRPLTIKDV